eukprot:11157730-Lingulodinium_polyedra.AAC.1
MARVFSTVRRVVRELGRRDQIPDVGQREAFVDRVQLTHRAFMREVHGVDVFHRVRVGLRKPRRGAFSDRADGVEDGVFAHCTATDRFAQHAPAQT